MKKWRINRLWARNRRVPKYNETRTQHWRRIVATALSASEKRDTDLAWAAWFREGKRYA